MKTALEINKEYANKYLQDVSGFFIPPFAKEVLINSEKIKKIIDLGCGDGLFIRSLRIFDYSKKVVGVDISSRRIDNLRKSLPLTRFYCTDVCNTGLKEKFDFVYSSQVIEHVENDKKMIKEIIKLTHKESYVYISSVVKKKFALYKYRNRFGEFSLDPTHEREYKTTKEFLDLFKDKFKLVKYKVSPVRRKILNLNIIIPGYYIIEALWKRKD